ncbi:GNAT family N-acetyltransferase [Streptomyces sp. NBC_01754]|uniref:GNAT family N-acetyltransferase n=1 Tax=Streptomyces sp. NBC_01754 TaxID=2975930 RepID=UPI002DDAF629|nr:GNAT family N-acetyltransferase [Streptomyces sp. NBC_01754]WSC92452.1 GNAT family N-acetyltransferase [Streptomyces sp. NBC_01754]
MDTELTVPTATEWDSWFGCLELAFGGTPLSPEAREMYAALDTPDRSLGHRDGGEWVGTAAAHAFRVAVPGGAVVPAAGVTAVSVAATHRRQGLLTAMMRRQLDDVRSWGEPIAVLTASEPGIYGRFGYGAASGELDLRIDTSQVRLAVPPGTDGVQIRYASPVEALDSCEAVYGRLAPGRPGTPLRRPGWERLPVIDPPARRQGGSPLQCVLARRDGEVTGYATFHVRAAGDHAGPQGTVAVRDLAALDPASYAALWRFLFGIDLTSTVECRNRPVDDAVLHLVSDVRRCEVRPRDGLYVRLVEAGAALEARRYRAPVDLVLDVEDAFCPWNAGRWRLTADAKGAASCRRTGDPADLALSVRELGAAYLGGVSLTSLASAGLVRESRAGAVEAASLAFSTDVQPWCPHGF